MKSFANANATSAVQASQLLRDSKQAGRVVALSGGGSDLLGLVKERVINPDVIVNLRTVKDLNQVATAGNRVTIGGLITLNALSANPVIRRDYTVLAEAAETVATPQIRNVGTLAGNVCQRPWCWYYRNGFPCYKAGGNQCYSFAGENQFHAIFGGGPSYIVHPSDTAPALVALNAQFRIVKSREERIVPGETFFVLPRQNAVKENDLADDEVLAGVTLPVWTGIRSAYEKEMDREAWTHAIVSAAVVLEMDGAVCRQARIVLGGVAPIPWRVPEAEKLLAGQRITEDVARRVGESSVTGARALSKNAYKIPMTKAVVERAILRAANAR